MTYSAAVHPVAPSLLPHPRLRQRCKAHPWTPLFIQLLIDHLHDHASDPGLEAVHFVHFVDAR